MAKYGYGYAYSLLKSGDGSAASADEALALVPIGSTWAGVSDGLGAPGGGVNSGAPNFFHRFMERIGGRLQPTIVPNMGLSGTTIKSVSGANQPWIYPYAIDALAAQYANIWVYGPMGANDNLLSTNPGANPASGSTSSSFLQDYYDAADYAWSKFVAQGVTALRFRVITPTTSTKTNESTYRAAVTAAIVAHWQAKADARIKICDLSVMLPPSDYSIDSAGTYVHVDERGAYFIADMLFDSLDAEVEAATDDAILDLIVAGTYPLMTGSQLDANTGLPGTAGTITGPGVAAVGGSGLATGKTITNTTGATGITVEQVATSGGRTKTVVHLPGTAAANDGKVMVQDTAVFNITGTPGQPYRLGNISRFPAGFRNMGADWGSGGGWGGGAASIADNVRAGANETHAISSLIFASGSVYGSVGTVLFGSSTTFGVRRSFAVFYKSGATMSGDIELERWFAYKPSNRTAGPMKYLGNLKNATTSFLITTNNRLRPTGTLSTSTGGTLRVEPGVWNMFGLTEADFATRQFWKGTSGDTAVDSGTQIGTDMTGTTWTQVFGAAAALAGELIYAQITDRDGVKWRSSVTITVGA